MYSVVLSFGLLPVEAFGNWRINSASFGKFNKKPMEFRSDVGSGVVDGGVKVRGAGVSGLAEVFIDEAELLPQVLTQRLPNSLHLRHGTSLSHLTFSLEHSSQAWRFRPRSRESGIAADPRSSHLLKWSRRTSLRLKVLVQKMQLNGRIPECCC